jgi:hypothetical protein
LLLLPAVLLIPGIPLLLNPIPHHHPIVLSLLPWVSGVGIQFVFGFVLLFEGVGLRVFRL